MRSPMNVCTMWTSTVLVAEALPAQPLIGSALSTVDRSGMGTSVGLVPEQPGGPSTVSVKLAVCTLDGDVPMIVIVWTPIGVLADVEMVSADEPPASTEVGLNDAVAPVGRPLAEKVTVSAEPLVSAVLTVADTDPPGVVEPEVGETETEKSFGVGHPASLPATFTAVQDACTVRYSREHRP